MKLRKVKDTEWLGNGFGSASAEWAVVGHENIRLRNKGNGCSDWMAYNTETNEILVRPYGWKRSEVLDQVAEKLA